MMKVIYMEVVQPHTLAVRRENECSSPVLPFSRSLKSLSTLLEADSFAYTHSLQITV